MTFEELPLRMVSKIDVDAESGCWNWTASRNKGYGQINWGGRPRGTHRVVYELIVGAIPSGLQIDHLCRNRSCCNPDHLEPVTHAENVRRGADAVTHCPQGHPYDEANTGYNGRGSTRRRCLACHRAQARARVRRLKEACK
jgi:hypothetical protein